MRRSLFSRVETWLGRFAWWQVLLGGGAVGLATSGLVLFIVAGYIQIHDGPFNWRDLAGDFYGNLPAEVVFFLVTIFVIDRLNRRRQRQQLKEQLIRQMGSSDNGVAVQAVVELSAHGWLTDGSLQEAVLSGANLQEADLNYANLSGANLQGAHLFRANMQGADLYYANLSGANLHYANLQGAKLHNANLHEASMFRANLQETDLNGANLQRAYLNGANLQRAHLADAEFDEGTIMPDDAKWRPYTVMAKFSDSDHLGFWRSDDPNSPAYGSGDDAEDNRYDS